MDGFLTSLINSLISVLPSDPFIDSINSFANSFGEYLGYVNFFVPFGRMVQILAVWIVAVGVFYVWRALASYLHLIG